MPGGNGGRGRPENSGGAAASQPQEVEDRALVRGGGVMDFVGWRATHDCRDPRDEGELDKYRAGGFWNGGE